MRQSEDAASRGSATTTLRSLRSRLFACLSLVTNERSPKALKTGSHRSNFRVIVGAIKVSGIDGCQGLGQSVDLLLERACGFGNVLHA
jgi:hypothetical protein